MERSTVKNNLGGTFFLTLVLFALCLVSPVGTATSGPCYPGAQVQSWSVPNPGGSLNGISVQLEGGVSRYVWYSQWYSGTIRRFDLVGGVVDRTFTSPSCSEFSTCESAGLAFVNGFLWHVSGWGRVYKLDPANGAVVSYASVSASPRGLAWDGSRFWTCDFDAGTVYSFDETGSVFNTFTSPCVHPCGVAWDGEAILVVGTEASQIYRIRPTDGSLVRQFDYHTYGPSAGDVTSLDFSEGKYLWYVDRTAGTVSKVDVGCSCVLLADDFGDGVLDGTLWVPVTRTFCFDPGPAKGIIQETGGELLLTTYEDPHGDTWVDAAYVKSDVNLKVGKSVDVDFVLRGLLEHEVSWSGGQIRIDITDGLDMPVSPGCRPAETNVQGTVNVKTFGVNDNVSNSSYVLSLNAVDQTATLYRDGTPVAGSTDIDISSLSSWYLRFYIDCAVSAESSTGRLHSSLWLDSVDARTEPCEQPVEATVDFDPNTLNLKSHGRWVTCYIELPQGYDVADIDIASVMLNGRIHTEERPSSIGDYDGDGCSDLMVKFDRSAVGAILTCGQNVQITVTGNVGSRQFSGTDYIRVIKPPAIPPKDDVGTSAADAITLELHPNPFNPSVEIAYGVPVPARVVVQILGVDGRLVRTLEDAERSGGLYTIIWDGRDSAGRDASSGLYFCRLVVGSKSVTKKLTMLR